MDHSFYFCFIFCIYIDGKCTIFLSGPDGSAPRSDCNITGFDGNSCADIFGFIRVIPDGNIIFRNNGYLASFSACDGDPFSAVNYTGTLCRNIQICKSFRFDFSAIFFRKQSNVCDLHADVSADVDRRFSAFFVFDDSILLGSHGQTFRRHRSISDGSILSPRFAPIDDQIPIGMIIRCQISFGTAAVRTDHLIGQCFRLRRFVILRISCSAHDTADTKRKQHQFCISFHTTSPYSPP